MEAEEEVEDLGEIMVELEDKVEDLTLILVEQVVVAEVEDQGNMEKIYI
jgi:hypothetical protein